MNPNPRLGNISSTFANLTCPISPRSSTPKSTPSIKSIDANICAATTALSRHNREKSPLSYTDTFGSPSSQNSIPLRVSIPPKNKQPSCGGKSNSPRYRFKIKSKKSNNSNTADCPTTFPSLKPFSIQKLGNSISLAKRLTTLSQAIPMI